MLSLRLYRISIQRSCCKVVRTPYGAPTNVQVSTRAQAQYPYFQTPSPDSAFANGRRYSIPTPLLAHFEGDENTSFSSQHVHSTHCSYPTGHRPRTSTSPSHWSSYSNDETIKWWRPKKRGCRTRFNLISYERYRWNE
jgi:hypothetical protein